jgi:hypothetical protein
MAKIEALRDALAVGSREAALSAAAVSRCPEPRSDDTVGPCLGAAAKAFGAPSFSAEHADQASAAAVAYLLVRDHDGVGMPRPDTWLAAIASAHGPGADALRLAVGAAMAHEAEVAGKRVDDEAAARALLAAVARAFPGACATYARLGRGDDLASFSPAESPDHSPCVQHDLERKEGPGPAYGDGLWRAAAGAEALWRDGARALTIGFATTEGPVRTALKKQLDVIDPATRALMVHLVATTQTGGYRSHAAPSP